MKTYAHLTEQLNAAAAKRDAYYAELESYAEQFAREVDRIWETGGKVQYGTVGEDGLFRPNEIGPLDETQAAIFAIAIEFEVSLIPRRKIFQVTIQKLRDSVQIGLGGQTHWVDIDKPVSFISAVNALQSVAYAWLQTEVAASQLF